MLGTAALTKAIADARTPEHVLRFVRAWGERFEAAHCNAAWGTISRHLKTEDRYVTGDRTRNLSMRWLLRC